MIKPLVIIPVYNEELILPHCLEHLHKNGIENIIVLDNESTDASANIAISYNAEVIPFSSDGKHCQETIIKIIQTTIHNFQREFDWILKVDADEFLYSPSGEPLIEFLQRINDRGFNCIGSFAQQTYPMSEEISSLRILFDPLRTLKHVIPHITNDKYTQKDHQYYMCIWKVSTFHRELTYRNSHFVDGSMRLAQELLILRHIPYTFPDYTYIRLIQNRKKRVATRNFEIGMSIHYQEIPDNCTFEFEHIQQACFNWVFLYKGYTKNFDTTVNMVREQLKNDKGQLYWKALRSSY